MTIGNSSSPWLHTGIRAVATSMVHTLVCIEIQANILYKIYLDNLDKFCNNNPHGQIFQLRRFQQPPPHQFTKEALQKLLQL